MLLCKLTESAGASEGFPGGGTEGAECGEKSVADGVLKRGISMLTFGVVGERNTITLMEGCAPSSGTDSLVLCDMFLHMSHVAQGEPPNLPSTHNYEHNKGLSASALEPKDRQTKHPARTTAGSTHETTTGAHVCAQQARVSPRGSRDSCRRTSQDRACSTGQSPYDARVARLPTMPSAQRYPRQS